MTKEQIEKIGNLMTWLSQIIPSLYLTKLLKLLYLVDENAVKQVGTPITWLTYKAWQFGPVPTVVYNDISFDDTRIFGDFIKAIREELRIPDTYQGKGYRIEPNKALDKSVFSPKEVAIIQEVISHYGDKSTNEIVELLHSEHSLWDRVYQEKKLEEHFKYAEYNTSPFEIDLTELIKGNEEKLSRYYAMEEFIAFTETFSE
ncbi:MAG: SocA family protein [Phaeodactylibacter sp.]|nr:SocA family protein [Phaeodactylibacter sp.]